MNDLIQVELLGAELVNLTKRKPDYSQPLTMELLLGRDAQLRAA